MNEARAGLFRWAVHAVENTGTPLRQFHYRSMTSPVPTGSPNKCHQLAEDCLQRAIMASSIELADQWLRIAGTWLAMEKFKQRRSEHAVDLTRIGVPNARKRFLGSSA